MKFINLLWATRRRPKRTPGPEFNAPKDEWIHCPDCDRLSPPDHPDGHFCLHCGTWF